MDPKLLFEKEFVNQSYWNSIMDSHHNNQTIQVEHPVSGGELNAWRRGFTPQAEIWNGRMAIIGLVIGLSCLLLMNSFF